MHAFAPVAWPLVLVAVLLLESPAWAGPVSFRNDVMAVLSKAGCNQGVCHGNLNGKNGFKLSLRGEDPEWDHQALTRDTLGRRTNPLHPADSLLLLKATTAVPHEGGRRFGPESPEHQILAHWIADGLPRDPPDTPTLRRIDVTPAQQVLIDPARTVRLHVEAAFSDGSRREVTRLAVYEPSEPIVQVTPDGLVEGRQNGETAILVRYLDQRATVRLALVPARPALADDQLRRAWGGSLPTAGDLIDYPILLKLRTLRLSPSGLCSDSAFVRRAYLDTLGMLPTAGEARAFLEDPRPEKRGRLIDNLLDRPEFADFWAQKWADVLRNEEKVLDRKGVEVFYHWIRRCLAEDKPLNEFARELIAGRGSTYEQPAANFYRALRDPQARAEAVGQVFLGVRLQCARCHNHPFDQWTQDDYHRLAAFFARVQYRIVNNNRRDRFDTHEFDGEQIVWQDRQSEVKDPRTGAELRPRFLGAPTPELGPDADRLQILADWVAAADNPFFARTQVNRIWFHLMGRGIVEPDDDFRASNPPVNGPLLEALTRDLIAHHFSLRHTARTIMNSRTYQLATVPNDSNREDETNFSHALVRPLQAEQLLDALAQVTGLSVKFNGHPLGLRAGQLPGVRPFRRREEPPTAGERFLKMFGKPDRLLSCECERSSDMTLGQAFQLLTGDLLNRLVSAPDNRLGRMLAQGKSDRQILEELYLAALGRFPRDSELEAAVAILRKAPDRRMALEDVLWALLNAKEFLFRP
jgi:uncharacterized protein DUF1549/uncharacterized protein DUF1553